MTIKDLKTKINDRDKEIETLKRTLTDRNMELKISITQRENSYGSLTSRIIKQGIEYEDPKIKENIWMK